MPACLRRLALRAGAFVLVASAAQAGADVPEWSLVPLPGGRQALLSALSMSPDVPAALLVGEVIRVAHASRDLETPVRARLQQHFASAGEGGIETVPLPLPLAAWRQLLGDRLTDRTLLAALLDDRRASMLCYGLLQLDRDTLAAIAADAGLLRRLYERHSGELASFAHVIVIRDGRLRLPGGADAEPAWVDLLGEPLSPASRAVISLLSTDEGRLLYFADTLRELDQRRLDLVFKGATAEVTASDQARSVYRAFTRIEPGWKLGDFPFVRLGGDPALLLPMLQPDSTTGRLRRTEAFWNVVLGDRKLPKNYAKRWSDLDDDDRAEPGWLLERVTDATLPVRLDRILVYQFVERLTDRLPGASVPDLAWLARGYRRFPALLLTLEQLGISDLPVLKRLVTHAGQLTAISADTGQLEVNLTLFQAPLLFVTRAWQAGAIDTPTVASLVARLSEIVPTKTGYGRAIGQWFDAAYLPAVGHDAALEGASAEASVLEALAGLRAPVDHSPPLVTWESHTYRVDLAAPELARLTEVRTRQGGNTLDGALALCRVGATLKASRTVDAARQAATTLAALEPTLAGIEPSERTTASPPADLTSLVGQASRDMSRVRGRGDVRRLEDIAGRLSLAEDAALADVMTSVLYAVWLGDPQGQAFLAGNVARRHDFGMRLMTGADREQTPWQLPLETSGDGQPWHLRGALLGLDVGLARLALRRTREDLPDDQPTLNESDRRTLMTTLALTSALDLDSAGAAKLAARLREGRAVAADPERLAGRLDALGLDGRRRQAVAWASVHDRETLPRLFLRTELVLLGGSDTEPVPDGWGAADTPRSGCLCLRFPTPPAVHRYAGRAGTGLVTSRMADLKLRVLEALDERRLPVMLAQAVLAAALHDYLDQVRPQHGDDWWALAHHLDRIGADRFDDYIAALTAGGPLVPQAPTATATNGHP